MDCRRALVLTVGLVSGALGCDHSSSVPLAPQPVVSAANIKKEPELPKRRPQAATCVAFAEMNAKAADEEGRAPLDQEQLRNQARKAYQQALDIDPKCLDALRGLARLYTALGDHDHA